MLELTSEALVAAPPETVWADWTEAPLLAAWFWPPRLEAAVDIDVAGGTWNVRSDVVQMAVVAAVLEADAPRSLRLGWRWDGEPGTTDVSVSLEPAADGSTRVIVRQTGFATAAERESHVEGWTHCLDRLVARHAA